MTNLDLEAIKARALAATPGPWEVKKYLGGGDEPPEFYVTNPSLEDDWEHPVGAVCGYDYENYHSTVSDEDAAHIAGMDPTMTLALVGEIEKLRRMP